MVPLRHMQRDRLASRLMETLMWVVVGGGVAVALVVIAIALFGANERSRKGDKDEGQDLR